MHNLNGNAAPRPIARLHGHGRDLETAAAICRLEWVLCVAFNDVVAVEDAFEGAYDALTAASQTARQFEAASRDLERAYDMWLATTLALAEEGGRSPIWGKAPVRRPSLPYLSLRPDESHERTAG